MTESHEAPSSTWPSEVTVTPVTSPVRKSSAPSCVQSDVLTAIACEAERIIKAAKAAAKHPADRKVGGAPFPEFRRSARPLWKYRQGRLLTAAHDAAGRNGCLQQRHALHRSALADLGPAAQHVQDGGRRLGDLAPVHRDALLLAIELHEELIAAALMAQDAEEVLHALGLEELGRALPLPLVGIGSVTGAQGHVPRGRSLRNAHGHDPRLLPLP